MADVSLDRIMLDGTLEAMVGDDLALLHAEQYPVLLRAAHRMLGDCEREIEDVGARLPLLYERREKLLAMIGRLEGSEDV